MNSEYTVMYRGHLEIAINILQPKNVDITKLIIDLDDQTLKLIHCIIKDQS